MADRWRREPLARTEWSATRSHHQGNRLIAASFAGIGAGCARLLLPDAIFVQAAFVVVGGLAVLNSLPAVSIIAVVPVSVFERIEIRVGGGSLRPAHVLLLVLLALAGAPFLAKLAVQIRRDLLAVVLIVGSLLGATAMQQTGDAVLFLLQMVLGVLLMFAVRTLVLALPPGRMRQLDVAVAIALIPSVVAALAVVAGVLPREGGGPLEFLGREARGTFTEITWGGMFAGIALLWFVARRRYYLAVPPALLVAALGARLGQVAVLGVVALVLVCRISPRAVPQALRVILVVTVLLTPFLYLQASHVGAGTSLGSRSADLGTVIRSVEEHPLPWYGDASRRFSDAARRRDLSDSSNNAVVDFVVKLGVLAVPMAIGLYRLLGLRRLRRLPHRLPRHLYPYLGCVMLFFGAVINNALGRPWFWIWLGLATAMAERSTAASPSPQPVRRGAVPGVEPA
jgi:hypothetical protein